MASFKRITQLELENFATGIASAEDADVNPLLSVGDVRAQELLFRNLLINAGKLTAEDELPSWADVYQKLINSGVRARIAAYIAWCTMPKRFRWPATQEELAVQVLGLTSDRAIATWRKRFPEIDMMISELQAEEMLEYRPGALHALGTIASDPSYRANPDRRLFFEMSGDYTPKQKITADDGHGVGRKMLDMLKKKSTAELMEMLGDDALSLVKELEEEVDSSTFPSTAGEEEE